VLVVHGDRDRSAPYAAGQTWAARLPNARLLTVSGTAHAPWIEAPGVVLPALQRFLDGEWPAGATRVVAATRLES
jgi:pimeloyl-ACP methyl ester carboxylesterase